LNYTWVKKTVNLSPEKHAFPKHFFFLKAQLGKSCG
jgi:hypothetical protein